MAVLSLKHLMDDYKALINSGLTIEWFIASDSSANATVLVSEINCMFIKTFIRYC